MKITFNVENNGIEGHIDNGKLMFSIDADQVQSNSMQDIEAVFEQLLRFYHYQSDGIEVNEKKKPLKEDVPKGRKKEVKAEQKVVSNDEKIDDGLIITEGYYKGQSLAKVYESDRAAIDYLLKKCEPATTEMIEQFLKEVA